MADSFAAPTGPPPPKVPEGWKAVWNDQYKEWFFVNLYTKVSQWDKPTEAVYPPNESSLSGPPPMYESKPGQHAPEKTGLPSSNPYTSSSHGLSEDEKLARRLQEEENARNSGAGSAQNRGAADSYYTQGGPGQPPQYGQQQQYGGSSGYGQPSYAQTPNPWEQQQQQQQYPQQQYSQQQHVTEGDKGKGKSGLLGKILGKATAHKQSSHMGGGAPMMMGRGQYGYPQQMYYQAPPGRRPGGGGMGMAGGAALGMGAGVLGGAMLGSAMAGDGGDGGDYGGDGGDYGGGDYGGDGGDFGGGDFGGGDFGGGGDF